jgi:hypothetical protein
MVDPAMSRSGTHVVVVAPEVQDPASAPGRNVHRLLEGASVRPRIAGPSCRKVRVCPPPAELSRRPRASYASVIPPLIATSWLAAFQVKDSPVDGSVLRLPAAASVVEKPFQAVIWSA